MKFSITIIFLIVALIISADAQVSDGKFAKEDLQKSNTELIALFQQKKFDEALPLAEKSLLISGQLYGAKHLETAKSLRNLGYIQYSNKGVKDAEKTFEKAYDVYKDVNSLSNADGSSVAEMLEILASIKYKEQIQRGEKHYTLALEWREKYNGKNSPETIKSLAALATINYVFLNYRKAADMYERILEIDLSGNTLSEADVETAFYRCECAYTKMGKIDEFEPIKKRYFANVKTKFLNDNKKVSVETDVKSPRTINAGMVNGKAIELPKPNYPAVAKATGTKGKVTVRVLIDEAGNVISACATGKQFLSESAERAAYGAKFRPTTLDGKSVRVTGDIIYIFN